MLINIDPILSPKLLSTLRSMGHGDRLVLADANFPATSLAKRLIRLDGINIATAAKAILSVFPLDSFIDYPVTRMEIDNHPEEVNDVHKDFINILKETSGDKWKIGTIERLQFYKEAKEAYAIVSTTDARAYGCFILTKGVIKPDGSVW
ncbi:MAG: ribose ABC transporter [Pelagibacteraceae bacterium]|nr:ribose ABC transporter [Pelagibacteraceae bacterium]HJL58547.1 RbsD/FucU domain-containing protein [Alphaproteobacteria bacterium]MBO6468001.1 ribose ABC transporter [Pelagibacteraceae bacterium]MBO6468611.1 ribose ABC transporter [Pelagibacteraceae bacterium]MBO6469823.1 ribose ABC transporter [Pelagibacteraceae bacterium]|tara:strand:+ start:1270 stop:1716 length:447 start_codon:yes stop_codon:yes gene_type:complete